MPDVTAASQPSISGVSLQLTATLMGFVGTALVIVQAWFWIPIAHANRAALILTASVPVIAAIFFTLAPRRVSQYAVQRHAVFTPMTWITLGLPLLLTFVVMVLIGMSDNFNNFAGIALLLAVNAGRNLSDLMRSLSLRSREVKAS
jgi:hypothetical protein